MHIKLSGDPEGGWVGEVHDGDAFKVYHPVGDTILHALDDMMDAHTKPAEPAPVAETPRDATGKFVSPAKSE